MTLDIYIDPSGRSVAWWSGKRPEGSRAFENLSAPIRGDEAMERGSNGRGEGTDR